MAKAKSELKEKPRRVIIRLYRQFDIDLIYMFEYLTELKMDHQKFVKSVIRAHINNSPRPAVKAQWIQDLLHPPVDKALVLRRKIQYHVLLDPVIDTDILDWLDTITIGYRNTVIKGLMRSFLDEPCIYPCLADTDLSFRGTDAQFKFEEDKA